MIHCLSSDLNFDISIFGYCLTTLHVPDLAAKAIIGFSDLAIVIALVVDLILLI